MAKQANCAKPRQANKEGYLDEQDVAADVGAVAVRIRRGAAQVALGQDITYRANRGRKHERRRKSSTWSA